MQIDSLWFLLALPITFGLGWLASRLDLRQLRLEHHSAPRAYFKGLNYLLNEQQDRAIDAFVEAVQKDPDTAELHFALGNLFRRRGEYERAVRVHEHLLARADLPPEDHERAQYDLAKDFLKAGLLDHAENALRKLEHSRYAQQAHLALLHIYERSRDWKQAGEAALQLERSGMGDFSQRRAHYLCEEAEQLAAGGHHEAAQALLEKARQTAPQAARPRLQLAELHAAQGEPAAAFDLLEDSLRAIPPFAPLIAAPYARLAPALQRTRHAVQVLQDLQGQSPSIDLVEALVTLDGAPDAPTALGGAPLAGAAERYIAHLENNPSLIAATRWLDREKLADDPHQPEVDRALQRAIKPLARYRCAACGFEAQQHFWHCPGCQSWDSYPPRRVEEL